MPDFPGRLRTPRLTTAPSSPTVGEMYYDTTFNRLYYWNGTVWVATDEFNDAIMSGILVAADCALTVNSITQVTIAAGTCYVSTGGSTSPVVRTTPTSTVLSGIPAASAGNFRLDQVVINTAGVISRLAGTEGAAVTLANRTGAAAIPSGSILLHDMLVPNAGVTTGNCRDRRPWALGFYFRGGMVAVQPPTTLAVDTAFNIRAEGHLSRVFEIQITGLVQSNTVGDYFQLQLQLDGVATNQDQYTTCNVANRPHALTAFWRPASVPGRLIQIATLRLGAANWNGGNPVMTVKEVPALSANNGIT
jgi:hypothetical protein